MSGCGKYVWPLCCELAGVEVPSDRRIDGKNILPILQGATTKTPHEFLYYYNGTNLQAVRQGDWKLLLDGNSVMLFDVRQDLGERHDLASHRPEVARRLRPLLAAWERDVDAAQGATPP